LGSSSDVPFGSFGEVSGAVSAYYMKPSGDRAAWIFMLNYANDRLFLNNVPLPGVAYTSRSEDGRLDGNDRLVFDSQDARLGLRASAGPGIFDASLVRAFA
jgi:hypothetical protein